MLITRCGDKTLWQRFAFYVRQLNRDAAAGTQYKVLFMGRHGEGYHNVAESYYGTPAWNVRPARCPSPPCLASPRPST